MIQGLCKGKNFITKVDLSTLVALLNSTNVPQWTPQVGANESEAKNKSESSVIDIMNSFIANNLNNSQNLFDNKQSIKGMHQFKYFAIFFISLSLFIRL